MCVRIYCVCVSICACLCGGKKNVFRQVWKAPVAALILETNWSKDFNHVKTANSGQ